MTLIETLFSYLVCFIYMGLVVYAFWYRLKTPTNYQLDMKIKILENKQEDLYKLIGELRNIIDVDIKNINDQSECLKKEIESINKILKVE